MTFEEYLELAENTNKVHRDWRLGQTLFNVLYNVRPILADRVRGTQFDPFYKRTPAQVQPFLDFVKERWTE